MPKLRHMQLGQSSEKLDMQIHQLELMLEDLEASEAARTASAQREPRQPSLERRQPVRRQLPDHLPREEIVHYPASVCPGCGGTRFSKIGEHLTEVLEKIPARRKVICHIRPKLSCRCCERIVQAPAPDLPIEKGRPDPELVANVVVGKFSTGCRSIAGRQSWPATASQSNAQRWADWVGHVACWVMPLAELIAAQVMAVPVIHTDDKRIAVFAPGNRRTRTGRLSVYVVDERPWQRGRPPAAYYCFSPDRRGERAAISAVFTIGYVANLLGEDENWLFELSIDCFPEDGCLGSTASARMASPPSSSSASNARDRHRRRTSCR